MYAEKIANKVEFIKVAVNAPWIFAQCAKLFVVNIANGNFFLCNISADLSR